MTEIKVVRRASPWEGLALGEVTVHLEAITAVERAAWRTREGSESGGLLAGRLLVEGGRIHVRVVRAVPTPSHDRSSIHFAFDGDAVHEARTAIAAAGEDVVGWYHTHPGGAPFMSPTDDNLHRTSFLESWQLSMVGSVALARPLIGIWHSAEGDIREVEGYTVAVSGGVRSWKDSTDDIPAEAWGPPEVELTPETLLEALELLDLDEPDIDVALRASGGGSVAAQWGSFVDFAMEGSSRGTIGTRLEDVGLVSRGTPFLPRHTSLAAEADCHGPLIVAIDADQTAMWALNLESLTTMPLTMSPEYGRILDVALHGSVAHVVTGSGRVVAIEGVDERTPGVRLSTEVLAEVDDPHNVRVFAGPAGCTLVNRGDGRAFAGEGENERVQLVRADPDLVVGAWDGRLVTTAANAGPVIELADLSSTVLGEWDLPSGLQGMRISSLKGRGPTVAVAGASLHDRSIALTLVEGTPAPDAMWLGMRGRAIDRAFPVPSSRGIILVEGGRMLALRPGAC